MTRSRMTHADFRFFLEDLTADCLETALTLYHLEQATEELLMRATEREMFAAEVAEDIWQNAHGNVRVSCRNCDGDFFVPFPAHGPYFCFACFTAGWPDAYPAVL